MTQEWLLQTGFNVFHIQTVHLQIVIITSKFSNCYSISIYSLTPHVHRHIYILFLNLQEITTPTFFNLCFTLPISTEHIILFSILLQCLVLFKSANKVFSPQSLTMFFGNSVCNINIYQAE